MRWNQRISKDRNTCQHIFYMFGRLGFVWFYGISTMLGYLMPNTFYIYIKYIWFGLVGFYSISTILGYLMPNLFYIYI